MSFKRVVKTEVIKSNYPDVTVILSVVGFLLKCILNIKRFAIDSKKKNTKWAVTKAMSRIYLTGVQ